MFWAAVGQGRVDATITILLAISALYILVFNNVPMVGYLTTFDSFSLTMFILMFLCAFCHAAMAKFMTKYQDHPARVLVCRIIDAIARIILPLFIIAFYFSRFPTAYGATSLGVVYTFVAVFGALVIPREAYEIYHVYILTMALILEKINNLEESSLEAYLYNFHTNGTFSSNLSALRRQTRVDQCKGDIEMTDNPIREERKDFEADINKFVYSQAEDMHIDNSGIRQSSS